MPKTANKALETMPKHSPTKKDGSRRRGKQPAPEEKVTPGTDLSAKGRRGSPKDAPKKPPIRKSTRVPNLDQPPPDLSGFKTTKGAKQLLKQAGFTELAESVSPAEPRGVSVRCSAQ